MPGVEALAWDDVNLSHLDERNAQRIAAGEIPISRAELDGLYEAGDYVTRDVEYRTRVGEWEWQVHLIGRTPAGRFLTIACQVADDGRYRPITVWPSSTTEEALYNEDVVGGE